MIPSSEISFQNLTVCAPVFNTLLRVLSTRKRATFTVLHKQMAPQVLLDFWGPNDGLNERRTAAEINYLNLLDTSPDILNCCLTLEQNKVSIKVCHFTELLYEASYCIVSNKQLSLWTDWMSDWTILCLSMKAPASMMLLATKQLRVLMSMSALSRLPYLTTVNSKCPLLNHKCDLPSIPALHII